jgi:hypothetical protein
MGWSLGARECLFRPRFPQNFAPSEIQRRKIVETIGAAPAKEDCFKRNQGTCTRHFLKKKEGLHMCASDTRPPAGKLDKYVAHAHVAAHEKPRRAQVCGRATSVRPRAPDTTRASCSVPLARGRRTRATQLAAWVHSPGTGIIRTLREAEQDKDTNSRNYRRSPKRPSQISFQIFVGQECKSSSGTQ